MWLQYYLICSNGIITSGGRLSAEHWAVRRWVSEVNGSVTISGKLADLQGGAGDGIVGHIFVDGIEVFNHLINDGDLTGINYNVKATVTVGSPVDFAVEPRSSDWTDSTRFTAVITFPVTLGFDSTKPWTTNGFGFMLQGPIDFNYVIQASTNLLNWQPITNFVSTNSTMYFCDPAATNYTQRFYRAVVP